jgi:hypothetical protein
MKINVFLFICVLFVGLDAHTSSLSAQSLARQETAANDANRRQEEALGGGSAQPLAGQDAAVQAVRGGAEPAWVRNPYAAYPHDRYIAAVGTAKNRSDAEKSAFAALTAFFGQSVKSDSTVTAAYSEAVRNGIVSVSENTSIRETIVTDASLDNLIGAATGNVWEDGRGTVYALAYMEKEKTASIYMELIRVNQRNIENLVSMNAAQKNTFDGYARYKLATLIAGMNAQYAGIVSLAGGAPLNMTGADTLILEAANIIKNITVGFSVKGDSNGRVRDTFAKALSGEGLRTQGNNPPYILEINIDMGEARFPNNNFIFCRYTLSAKLIERATGSVILPFNITDREGHATYAEAQNRAFVSMERAVNEKYPAAFREYLAALLPQK